MNNNLDGVDSVDKDSINKFAGKLRIAVLASGRGSNMRALVDSCKSGFINGSVELIISDKQSQALEWAKSNDIKPVFLDSKNYSSRESYDKEIVKILRENNIDLVCLAGFMRIVTKEIIDSYKNKLMNIHPALLPMFPGLNAQEQAFNAKVQFSGCTVHFVDEGMDTGPIIIQAVVPVKVDDTPELLSARILEQEHKIYPIAVKLFAENKLKIEERIDDFLPARNEVIINDSEYEDILKDFKYDSLRKSKIKTVLISVADKTGIVEFASKLREYIPDIKIISTGGTAKLILNSIEVSSLTGFPELFDGRVKTLHPFIAGGILMNPDSEFHNAQALSYGISKIDLVVCNLYPFSKYAEKNAEICELIENIDIGGVTLIRAAAKNFKHTAIIVDPFDYCQVLENIKVDQSISESFKKQLAAKAFNHTADYDILIAQELDKRFSSKEHLNLKYSLHSELRYGENPHQKSKFFVKEGGFFQKIKQLSGKELSFNNIVDIDAAWNSVLEIKDRPSVSIVKHTNPCGFATGKTLAQAFQKAWEGDDVSSFGSIIAFSRELDEETALLMKNRFVEVVVAPGISEKALELLKIKKDLRIIITSNEKSSERSNEKSKSEYSQVLFTHEIDPEVNPENFDEKYDPKNYNYNFVNSGVLVQTPDNITASEIKVVTKEDFSIDMLELAEFSYKAVKHVKSNAIVVARRYKTSDKGKSNKINDNCFQILGIGAGQPNRLNSIKLSTEKAKDNLRKEAQRLNVDEQSHIDSEMKKLVLASDAFFPFKDNVEACYLAGIKYIIQPGGSKKDDEVIAECNNLGIAMMFTGIRHFRH